MEFNDVHISVIVHEDGIAAEAAILAGDHRVSATGISKRRAKDTFSKPVGKTLAIGRALQALGEELETRGKAADEELHAPAEPPYFRESGATVNPYSKLCGGAQFVPAPVPESASSEPWVFTNVDLMRERYGLPVLDTPHTPRCHWTYETAPEYGSMTNPDVGL